MHIYATNSNSLRPTGILAYVLSVPFNSSNSTDQIPKDSDLDKVPVRIGTCRSPCSYSPGTTCQARSLVSMFSALKNILGIRTTNHSTKSTEASLFSGSGEQCGRLP